MAGGLLKEAHPVVEKVRSWLADEDWEALGQAAHYARANLAKVVGRVPGALGTLHDVVGDLGLEDAGRLGAAIGKVANLLEEVFGNIFTRQLRCPWFPCTASSRSN